MTPHSRARAAKVSDENGIEDNNNDGDLIEEVKDDVDVLLPAKKVNTHCKIIYVGVVIGFNVIFWIVALEEFLIPAENYL